MKLGVITTSYPRTPGDPAGSFVAAHVDALRALGHDVEVIAAGTPGRRAVGDPAARGSAASDPTASDPTARGSEASDSAARGSEASDSAARGSEASDSAARGSEASDSAARGSRAPRSVTWIASSLFDHGGAPDHLERHPVRTLAAAALIAARMTLAVSRRAKRWDSIVAHWLVPSAIAALPTSVPLLAIAHGGDVHTLRRVKLLAPVLELLYRRDAQLAFVSEPLRVIAREAAPRLAAWLDTATVQPMGLDLARFSRVGHTPTQPPTIVVAARLVSIKGVDVAIDALAHLRAPVRLVIAGDGPERVRLESRARERVVSGAADTHAPARTSFAVSGAADTHAPARTSFAVSGAADTHAPARTSFAVSGAAGQPLHTIEFLGAVDTVRRDALLREASVVVVPSRVTPSGRTEGMPMIALEALAAGVPVVASAVGGLSGLGPAAVLVRPDRPRELAAAIDQTLSEPPDAHWLRAAVADLDWVNVATRLVRSP